MLETKIKQLNAILDAPYWRKGNVFLENMDLFDALCSYKSLLEHLNDDPDDDFMIWFCSRESVCRLERYAIHNPVGYSEFLKKNEKLIHFVYTVAFSTKKGSDYWYDPLEIGLKDVL